jgi:hypothetical protein
MYNRKQFFIIKFIVKPKITFAVLDNEKMSEKSLVEAMRLLLVAIEMILRDKDDLGILGLGLKLHLFSMSESFLLS